MSSRMHVTTYFLERLKAPTQLPQLPNNTEVRRVTNIDLETYRELYQSVGAPWLWYERSELDDDTLGSLINDPKVSIHTLRHDGQVAGYAELRSTSTHETQILYFGLRPACIGKGLGLRFLDWTIHHAFGAGTRRLWVHTCSLDHDRALTTYKRAGFDVYQQESGWVTIPEAALARKIASP